MTTGRVIPYRGKYAYVISAPRDPVTGKYRQIWRTGFASQKEAREKLRAHLNELDGGLPASDMTVGEWLVRWLRTEATDYTPLTLKSHTSCVHHHLIPRLGTVRLAKLDHVDIQRLYTALLRDLAPVTVHKIHRTLRAALNRAVKRGLLHESPMSRVDAPSGRSARRETLSVADAMRMLSWLRERGYVAYYGVYLALYGGLRLGEVCGLRWRDVDAAAGVVHVRQTRQRIGGVDIVGRPKTADSAREVVLPAFAMQEVERWRTESPWATTPDDYVIRRRDGKLPETHAFAKGVRAALTALDVPPVTFHDLRHTHATWLLESGVDLTTVSRRLGHSSITVTADVYSHVTRRLQREAMAKMEEMMRKNEGKKEDL